MRVLAAGLILVALVLPSTVHAQAPPVGVVASQLAADVADPGRALLPGKNESLDMSVTYTVNAGAAPAPAPDAQNPDNTTRTKVHLSVKQKPSWVDAVVFPSETVEFSVQPGQTSSTKGLVLVLQINKKAPALQREELVIVAKADPNGNIGPSQGESAPIKLRAAYVPKLNITAPQMTLVPGGRWTVLPFTIKNLGNAEAPALLNVTARPQNSQAEFPQNVTVPLDGQAVVEVRIRVPWTFAEEGTVTLEATPILKDDLGKPTHADTEILGQSAAPGVGVPLLLGALVLLALARRR